MKINTILDQIDLGSIGLPKFQRGYVWNRHQVRNLMYSLYRKFPIGSLIVWKTASDKAQSRGEEKQDGGYIGLLLDGQQRVTSLYGIIKGKSPNFFDGNPTSFTGLYFNLDDEVFEFYIPLKMKDNPVWVNVTELMIRGIGEYTKRLMKIENLKLDIEEYINRLNAIVSIKHIDLHIEEISGEDKTVDTVVEIFNKVNEGGTKLSKGDLALAKICASWPEGRDEMVKRLNIWKKAGFYFNLDWLLRCMNAFITGESLFLHLKDKKTPEIKEGLIETEKIINYLLNLISSRLGLDHDRVLGSLYSFPLMVSYIKAQEGSISDYKEQDKLLYWYIHTLLWGRYSNSTESTLSQDLSIVNKSDGGLDSLVNQMKKKRADLNVRPQDFEGWSQGTRFYPFLYMLTRVWHAKDWGSGIELSNHLLGNNNTLELHHIFPKSLLYKHGYTREKVNAIANFTFLTKETNRKVSDRDPGEYFEEILNNQPGVLESHWIPMDRNLWKVENYLSFLAARRELLAKAANEFLNSLLIGSIEEIVTTTSIFERSVTSIPGSIASEDEEKLLHQWNEWVIKQGLPGGEMEYELLEPETGKVLAILDLAWPNGIQEGLSKPVTILIDEERETEEIVNKMGYRYFTNLKDFHIYVCNDILAVDELIPLDFEISNEYVDKAIAEKVIQLDEAKTEEQLVVTKYGTRGENFLKQIPAELQHVYKECLDFWQRKNYLYISFSEKDFSLVAKINEKPETILFASIAISLITKENIEKWCIGMEVYEKYSNTIKSISFPVEGKRFIDHKVLSPEELKVILKATDDFIEEVIHIRQ
jgi:hypothetical protein